MRDVSAFPYYCARSVLGSLTDIPVVNCNMLFGLIPKGIPSRRGDIHRRWGTSDLAGAGTMSKEAHRARIPASPMH